MIVRAKPDVLVRLLPSTTAKGVNMNSLEQELLLSVTTEEREAAIKVFFNRYADYYERSWDTREHGLHVGIFDRYATSDDCSGLEAAYQRSRDHVAALLEQISPLGPHARILDVCCGTGATLAQVVDHHDCLGVGVDISEAQLRHADRLRLHGEKKLRGRLSFREGSASLVGQVVGDLAPFTHVLSQDGLLFAYDKRESLREIHDLLVPNGALVISDFVPQVSKAEIDAALRARVYEDVKWAEGLAFQEYQTLLRETGFELVQAELRPFDMRTTYEKLASRTQAMAADGDQHMRSWRGAMLELSKRWTMEH